MLRASEKDLSLLSTFEFWSLVGWQNTTGSPDLDSKVEIFLEQEEVAFLSPSKICENSNFSTVHL